MDKKTLRPKDAATLVLYRGHGNNLRILLGQRHQGHAFMPNAYVFPGGRVNSSDSRAIPSSELRSGVAKMLERAATPARARAIAVAAVRETFEETGLLVASGASDNNQWHNKIGPLLGSMDYFFRAITPPNRIRRFDARFFSVQASEARGSLGGDGELKNLSWFTLNEISKLEMASITRIALAEFRRVIAVQSLDKSSRLIPVSRYIRGQYKITME
ncbi:MAG: NUDIX hydrolase [Rhodospirillales bacterium]|jgi:8-oxo-dGTP pyrophosphatase MutT (NUDIX family)|nr:NUDIX hydrolase [Rhodospirillales bacterium]MBC92793.1 NUDIX hydrolase [Rhodospirillaceae bacterium]|tara:strand:- start:2304 stop:2951 length:648 start_codon:yes stop_codon:yes gene_type:complete